MPAALSYPMNMARYDWGYVAEPEEGLGGRRLVPRARSWRVVLNKWHDYVRGNAGDYAHWEEAGATGWGYADVLPIFVVWNSRMVVRHAGVGRWTAACDTWSRDSPLHDAFVESAVAAGYVHADYNGYRQEGLARPT